MSIQTRTLILPKSRRPLTYELERKAVKRLNLRVRDDGTVHLSIPKRTTVTEAEAFLRDHEEWVLGALSRMEKRAEAHPTAETVGDSLPYLGGKLEVVWQVGSPARVEANMAEGRLTVTLPSPADPEMRAAAIETFEIAETRKLVTALVDRYYPSSPPAGCPTPRPFGSRS